ncbi:probable ABC transporter, ATP-binding protein; probable MrsF protein [Bacillus sp. NRRL B-14911]|uniref:Bacitracin ABC transporter ATP-binding protein n=1 Tax=Bacillus infantis NRRL B-14911 TaxID=1367477 RepID=U5LIY4_9BACI|nr:MULTISPECIES: ABC transporter ATP-binding protein [Bacillus]AGX06661.1 bacitracin ABC transporter ATP-binding protein [Bacillus infantis NRRL B-14911]EAR63669.1 probable ABC transporter, ATP-binding protein; probable MrsF protein [Bacillus sp. NRRL B-14911]MDT0161438.1 ABC transporter ATP-binding protein [Bacillus sp. AG4(2022)]
MSELILETNGLTKKFGKRSAVENVDLRLAKGEIYGFLGPNGAGKTTTIRMLLGLARPTGGSIHIFGRDLKKEKLQILRKVGSLVEYPSYYGHLTAIENLEALRRILEVPKSRIDEVLAIVRLSKEAKRPVKGFSLGMKQRLGIAAALLANPELLILDEPTNGLDPSGILEIRELIKSMPAQHGMTILVSSHLLSEIDQMATQVGIISKGSMIFQDSIHVLRQKANSQIAITVNETEKAWRALLSNGIQAEKKREHLLLDGTDTQVAAAVETLVRHDVSVYRVQEQRKTLEDIFLELTGEGGSL